MNRNRILVSFAIALFLIGPAVSNAQTTDTQNNIATVLEQIITLQKQLIELLQNEITQLSAQIASLQTQLARSSQINASHICGIVSPPACSTTLTVTRDSYNCVTGYQCATGPTTATQPVQPTPQSTTASCTAGSTTYPNGQSLPTLTWCQQQTGGCPLGLTYSSAMTCSNGQWVPQTQGGCWHDGKYYPEGTLLPWDSGGSVTGTVAGLYGQCKEGDWVFAGAQIP